MSESQISRICTLPAIFHTRRYRAGGWNRIELSGLRSPVKMLEFWLGTWSYGARAGWLFEATCKYVMRERELEGIAHIAVNGDQF